MNMPIPRELIVLVVLLLVAALAITLVLRRDWWPEGGRLDYWKLFEDTFSQFLLLGMLISLTMQIGIRYALSDYVTAPWTEEFARLVMVWLAMFGAASIQRSDDHISMTIVFNLLGDRAKRWVRVFGDVVTIFVLVPVVWYGWETSISLNIMYTIQLGVPLSLFAYPIPVAGTLMIVHSVMLIYRRLRDEPIQSSLDLEV
jgi:TRAP-type C4-dicarboxylate transport system permease small subunit